MPETASLSKAVLAIANNDKNKSDKWLNAALNVYKGELNYENIDPNSVIMLSSTAEEGGATWRYTVEQPSENWASEDFDDSSWSKGTSLFGGADFKNAKTKWTEDDIWMRQVVTITD